MNSYVASRYVNYVCLADTILRVEIVDIGGRVRGGDVICWVHREAINLSDCGVEVRDKVYGRCRLAVCAGSLTNIGINDYLKVSQTRVDCSDFACIGDCTRGLLFCRWHVGESVTDKTLASSSYFCLACTILKEEKVASQAAQVDELGTKLTSLRWAAHGNRGCQGISTLKVCACSEAASNRTRRSDGVIRFRYLMARINYDLICHLYRRICFNSHVGEVVTTVQWEGRSGRIICDGDFCSVARIICHCIRLIGRFSIKSLTYSQIADFCISGVGHTDHAL